MSASKLGTYLSIQDSFEETYTSYAGCSLNRVVGKTEGDETTDRRPTAYGLLDIKTNSALDLKVCQIDPKIVTQSRRVSTSVFLQAWGRIGQDTAILSN